MIDAHLHFWNSDKAVHNWPDDLAPVLRRGFSPADLAPEMALAGVTRIVLMQSRNDFAESIGFAELAARSSFVGALVGWADLAIPLAVPGQLAELASCGKLRGIRHLVNFEADGRWLLRDPVQRSIEMLASASLVLDVVPTDAVRFDAVLETARNHPSLQIVMDHMARPPIGRPAGRWAEQVREAADLPNIAMKLSVGLDVLHGWQWRPDDLVPFVDHLVECFGPRRLMAASNWPVILASAPSYHQAWKSLENLLGHLDEPGRQQVLSGTARRLFKISNP